MLGRTATGPLKLGLGTISALAFCGQIGLAQAQEPTSLPVKVVVVTMFELGEDTGDRPGEACCRWTATAASRACSRTDRRVRSGVSIRCGPLSARHEGCRKVSVSIR